jgi:hypothetical protein
MTAEPTATAGECCSALPHTRPTLPPCRERERKVGHNLYTHTHARSPHRLPTGKDKGYTHNMTAQRSHTGYLLWLFSEAVSCCRVSSRDSRLRQQRDRNLSRGSLGRKDRSNSLATALNNPAAILSGTTDRPVWEGETQLHTHTHTHTHTEMSTHKSTISPGSCRSRSAARQSTVNETPASPSSGTLPVGGT